MLLEDLLSHAFVIEGWFVGCFHQPCVDLPVVTAQSRHLQGNVWQVKRIDQRDSHSANSRQQIVHSKLNLGQMMRLKKQYDSILKSNLWLFASMDGLIGVSKYQNVGVSHKVTRMSLYP